MKFRKRFKSSAEVPNSSMSDIAFLLLIFFMVTTAFAARKGLDLRLPSATAPAGVVVPVSAIHIQIQETGAILINGEPRNVEEIRSIVGPAIEKKPTVPVILQVHDDALYDHMICVLDELRRIGVQNISLPTREDISSW